MLRVLNFRGARAPDAPGGGEPPLLHRKRLLLLGWGLAGALPFVVLGLLVVEYLQVQRQAAVHTHVLVDAIERQLRDRLFLVGRQLVRAADPSPPRGSYAIAMDAIDVRPLTASERSTVSTELQLGAPVSAHGGWWIPVSRRVGERMVHARVPAELLEDVVRGYHLGAHDFISLIHDERVLVARSVDHDRLIGRPIEGSRIFAPEHQTRREGEYTGHSVVDDVWRHYTYRRLGDLPLTLLVGLERQQLVTAWVGPAVAVLGLALLLALAWGWLVRRYDRMQTGQRELIVRLQGAAQENARSEERLRQAHALALFGDYEMDLESGHVLLSDEVARIVGLPADTGPVRPGRLRALVHPGNRARLEAMDRAIAEGRPFSQELRLLRDDGSVRHVHVRAARARASDGRDVIRGVVQDVTEQASARARAEQAEAQYRFLFEHNPMPMWVFDRESLEILAVNDAMLAHYGYERDGLVGRDMLVLRPQGDADAVREAARLDSSQATQGRVWTHLHRSGRAMRVALFRHDIEFAGRSARLVAAQDVTEREQTEQRFRMIARATSDAVYDYDVATQRIWWSDSYYTRFGQVPRSEHTLEEWAHNVHPADLARVQASLQAALDGVAGEWQEQYRFRRGDGSYATVLERAFIQRDENGHALRLVGGMLDISERQHYEDQLAYRATHDVLTGLPNRQLLVDRVEQAIHNAERHDREAALIFIDLDDFKLVNDSLGHSAGDRVLQEVANRLRAVARSTDTVARFGGDEFVIVLCEHSGQAGIDEVLTRVRAALAVPVTIAGTDHTVTASLGWCRYPEGGNDAETLLMHGDMAMYQAKRQGRNRAVAYQREFAHAASQRLQLVSQLRLALERGEFVPVFQPLYDRDGRLSALETLARWQHPERGLLFPGEFIEACESSGLIVELGRQMLAHAARYWHRLAEQGLGHVRIAVNVSPAQFTDELVRDVTGVIDGFGVPAEAIELEITEGLLMGDPERAIALMAQIVARGVSFAIDDFGTGYSSLAYLKRFPIDRLKIDRSFVRDLGADEDDAAICTSIIGLARSMGIRTVAEGVESQLQLDWLRKQQIDEVQGYLLGRPCAFEALPLDQEIRRLSPAIAV